jgi:dTDP-glucose pyrophosphorylase
MKDFNWKKTIIFPDSTIKDAIKILNRSGKKILLFLDKNLYLIGTISDGDIRRGLLNGVSLNSKIDKVVNKNPTTVLPNKDATFIYDLMINLEVDQIPEVNEKGICTGLYLKDFKEAHKELENTLIIMAGGKGKRLFPRTKDCPKPLLEVKNKPIILHIIENAKRNGIYKFIISLNYLGHKIEDFLQNGEKYGVEISYLKEKSPLGTAGSLSLIKNIPKSPLIVINGDLISNINFHEILKFHNKTDSSATMAIKVIENQNPFGVVKIKGTDIVGFEEKPIERSYVNAGIYVINSECLNFLNKSEYIDMPYLFEKLKDKNKKISAYLLNESWIDIGKEDDFLNANK